MSRKRAWGEVDVVPSEPCEYRLFRDDELIRNGSSCNCKRRLKEHRRGVPEANGFQIQIFDSSETARRVEKAFCRINKPPMNKRCG